MTAASFCDDDRAVWSETLDAIRSQVPTCTAFEDAAALVTRELYTRFESVTALARVYAVIAYRDLEPGVRAFVDQLAVKTGQTERIVPATPVLTLLGTHGAKEEWCSRHTSQGHVGIPLVSAEFVQGIPMVARLLKELGVDLAGFDVAANVNARKMLGGFNGLFYVEDAGTARDSLDRLIIPAQDFVEEQGVKTVFGMGGFYPDNTLIVIIVFARERLLRSQVERLTSLLSLVKGETFGLLRARKLFDSARRG